MAYLSHRDYPEVRAALGVRITPESLPDDLIARPIYHDEAEGWAAAQVPAGVTPTTEQAEGLRRAAVLYLAALLVYAVPWPKDETENGWTVHLNTETLSEMSARLAARALRMVPEWEVVTTTSPTRITRFTILSATRGR